jgi:hypothetical protein
VARRVLALIFLGLALIVCVALAASESLTNRTGRTATAVAVTFSEQVRITSFDETVFPTKEPSSRSDTFTFSGGQLENGARFSVSWTPSTAEITTTEWETTGASAGASSNSTPLTYEQIMAQIAHYPGPDELLYVPAEGEQIWLTDLEGHADTYDNDSIKINYAPGFDKSQITRIDVYRNGIKMRFVPALFDVLTNDQMKTFDGNPAENSPKSTHTDHAIVGYQYSFRLYKAGGTSVEKVLLATVQNAVSLSGAYLMAYINHNWWEALRPGRFYGPEPSAFFSQLKAMGFRGVQLRVHLFMDDMSATEVFPIYDFYSARTLNWQRTASDAEIVTMLSFIRDADLDAELAVEIWTTLDCRNSNPNVNTERGSIFPRSVSTWFDNYAAVCMHYAALAQANHVEYFCPIVELETMEQYTDEVTDLLGEVANVFSGQLSISEGTNKMAFGWFPKGGHLGQFWGYDGMLIGMNTWVEELETQKDQRFSAMLERFVAFWRPFVEEYRRLYPGHKIVFEENGFYNYDGAALGWGHEGTNPLRDDQEVADYWAAAFVGLEALGMDGTAVWCIDIRDPNTLVGAATLNQSPFTNIIGSFVK